MQDNSRNIYKNARKYAGMTQERWAEAIGCSVESVRNYEAGTQIPSDEIARAMAESSSQLILCYWHICNKSSLAYDELPELDRLPLPQAVLELLVAMDEFTARNGDLMRVASDGRISPDEVESWAAIRAKLDAVIRAALQVKYSEGGGHA